MDLLIGALMVVAIAIAIFLLYKRIFNSRRSKVDAEQEISVKEVLGKEVSNMEDHNISQSSKDSIHKRTNKDDVDSSSKK